jgi:hypothetical protein
MDETIQQNSNGYDDRLFLSMRSLLIAFLVMSGFHMTTVFLTIQTSISHHQLDGLDRYDLDGIIFLLVLAVLTSISTILVLLREQSFQHLRRDLRLSSTFIFILYIITLIPSSGVLDPLFNGVICFCYFFIWIFFMVGLGGHPADSVFHESGGPLMRGFEFLSGACDHPVSHMEQITQPGKVSLSEFYLVCGFSLIYSIALGLFVATSDSIHSIWSNTSNSFIFLEFGISVILVWGFLDLANHWEGVDHGRLVMKVLCVFQLVWMTVVSIVLAENTAWCFLPVLIPFLLTVDFFHRMDKPVKLPEDELTPV